MSRREVPKETLIATLHALQTLEEPLANASIAGPEKLAANIDDEQVAAVVREAQELQEVLRTEGVTEGANGANGANASEPSTQAALEEDGVAAGKSGTSGDTGREDLLAWNNPVW